MRISQVIWGRNTAYATRRASVEEIEDVLLAHGSTFRRNLRGRVATHTASGRTANGRALTVAFVYLRRLRAAVPINAWEDR
jgi:hypothetical protein